MMYVSELWIYPIKSCRGIAVESLQLEDRGPRNDRRWMLVDNDGVFISQRTVPRLALVDVALAGDDVLVSTPGTSPLRLSVPRQSPEEPCTIWDDTVPLRYTDEAANEWFSSLLQIDCRLMYMPVSTQRVVDPTYSPERRLVSLADAFPLLLIGQASLDLLNEKLIAKGEDAVPMKRFRPNVVVAGATPHAEDEWQRIDIGGSMYDVVKPCARCSTTTVDTTTGIPGKEPLRTLAEYRKRGSKVMFGQNVIHATQSVVRVNDVVSVVA